MNRAFRLVWSDAAGGFVAVAELVSGRGKGRAGAAKAVASVALAGAALSAWGQATPPPTTALPQGGSVTQGQAQWAQNGNRLDVTQGSAKAAINWQRFDIGAQAEVRFLQPNANSVALNRVVGGNLSQVFGKLSANGQVLLVNPNGIVFGQGSQVDVGGLVASTMNLSDEDFLAGRLRFTRGSSTASVVNQGTLTAADGGYVALLAPEVRNEGVISARLGTVALAGGDAVTLNFDGSQLLGIKVDPSTLDTLIENRQALVADGGQVILAAGAARQLLQQAVAGGSSASQMVEQDGVVRLVSTSGSIAAAGGRVSISGGNVDVSGAITARDGGSIQLQGEYVGQSARLDVSSRTGHGGAVQVQAETVVQTAQAAIVADGATAGGRIAVTGSTGANSSATIYSSAQFSAQSSAGRGGSIDLTAASVQLRAATLDASGTLGGRLRVGGGFHGADADLGNATTVGINAATVLRADANGARGDGGQIVVWSDAKTLFAGSLSARGGTLGGAGGQAEVSGKQDLIFQGLADLSSRDGRNGQLLLDPRNILVDNASTALATLDLSDPTPTTTNGFGSTVQVLGNGNAVITSPTANTGATTATGAAYLFNSSTGALLANLRGPSANDKIGSGGIKVLGNGNYLVLSPDFGTITNRTVTSYDSQDSSGSAASPAASRAYALVDNTTASAGAITWQSQTGSGSHTVGSGNSLVGSTSNVDSLVRYTYSGLTVNNAGSVTVTANDRVGGGDQLDAGGSNVVRPGTTITELTDGNLAIGVPTWFNGRGAVAWMDASTGQLAGGASGGAISSSTALLGSSPNRTQAPVDAAASDSSKKVYVLGQRTPYNPAYTPVDLERFGTASLPYQYSDGGTNRRTTTPGAAGDLVGQLVTPLPGGGYVINSPLWTNGSATYAGAVTWVSAGGLVGTIGTNNSLVGSSAYDFVGSGGVKQVGLTGQNYVVVSPYWSGNGNTAAGRFLENSPNGAVTWVDGSNGQPFGVGATNAAVSASNSRIGDAGDGIGAYSLGDSSLYSSYDYNGSTLITTSTTRKSGALSGGVRVLSNGNYLIDATTWTGSAGAVGFGDGAIGTAGVATSSNSLVGSTGSDQVGQFIVELAGGNYAVVSPNWDNGAAANAGAVTWGSGTAGRTGAVGSGNSLVGSDAYEAVGSGGVLAVGATGANGLRSNYIVLSPQWGNRSSAAQTTVAYGAVTWVDGSNGQPFAAGSTGAAVSSSNSLVGNHAGDYVGSVHYGDHRGYGAYSSNSNGIYYSSIGNWDAQLTSAVAVLSDGSYVARSPNWDSGKGAVTLGSGSTGLAGNISASNSLVGTTSDVTSLSTTNQTRGGIAWTDATTYLTTTGDHIGLLGGALNGGSYLVVSPFWGSGKGAVSWLGSGNSTGTVSSSNSLVGNTADTFNNGNHTAITAVGDRLGTLATTAWATPTVSSGTIAGQPVTTTLTRPVGPYVATASTATFGSDYSVPTPQPLSLLIDVYGITTGFVLNVTPIYQQLTNGNVLVASPNWNNTGAAQAGAVTWMNGSNGQLASGASGGVLSASNSLVGSHAGDYIGFRLPIDGVTELTNGNFVLSNSQWYSERGAVTWGSGTAGVTGTISASNSMVGTTPSTSVQQPTGNQKLLGMTDSADYIYRYIEGKGFNYDWPDRVTTMDGDRLGWGGVKALADGNAVVASPFWASSAAWDQFSAPASKGAATWINGGTGQLKDGSPGGAVSATNSLVGAVAGDAVAYSAYIDPNSAQHFAFGGITTLAGGRYAIVSPWWSNGSATGAGAVTFGGTGGVSGTVSTSNSLVGSSTGDHIGMATSLYDSYLGTSSVISGVAAVTTNGQTNYVVRSSHWTNTADRSAGGAGAGAVTWVDGSTGHAYGESSTGAAVSASNSLVGNAAGDGVGANYVALTRNGTATGDLLFMSALDYCGIDGYGAVTLLSGAQGAAGQVSWRNSILGIAQTSLGQNTSTVGVGTLTSDIRVAMLPTAVTSAERVAYRPLIWAAPNGSSGNNSNHVYAATLVDESASGGSIVTPIHNAGGANWNGSRFVPDGSAYTASGGSTSTGLLGFSANPSTDIVITPSAITGMLNAGTGVTLQANNDIRVARAITTSASGAGGSLTLEAGRSVYVDASITTDNGNLTLIANQGVAQGVVDANCSSCVSEIVQRAGTTLDAGTGQVAITLKKSTDKTSNAAGDIVLANVNGAGIAVTNAGLNGSSQGRGVRFQGGAVIGGAGTQSLVFQVGGYTAQGGGLLLAGDTQLVGTSTGTLQVAAADPTLTAAIGGNNNGFGITTGQIGAVIQQSSGFTDLKFGRTDQSGATSISTLDFTQASMKRGGATLDADVSLLGGSGGVPLGGNIASGEATGRRLALQANGGTLALGNNTVTASTGVLELATGTSGTITQGASGTVSANQLILSGTGTATLNGSGNAVGTVAGQLGSGTLTNAATSLTVGSVDGVDGLSFTSGGTVRAAGASSDVVLNKTLSTGSNDLIVAAGRNFVNNLPTDTGLSVGSGRYLVYSTSPSATTEGMSSYSKRYNLSYSSSPGSGNWFVYSTAPTLTVSVGSGSSITYGDSGAAPGVIITGFIDGDTQGSATTGSLNFTSSSYAPSSAGFMPAGTYTVNLTGQGTFASSLGYQITVNTGSSNFTVNPKSINVSGLTAANKVYDGTTTAQVSGGASISGGGVNASDGKALNGDDVYISGTATGAFADRHAGTGKSVTLAGLTLGGADGGNYTISAGSVQANITPKALTASGLTVAASRSYNGGVVATPIGTAALLTTETAGSGSTADGKPYSLDTVSLSGTATATYNSSQVALASQVQFGGLTLSGANAGNYTLTAGTQAATITPKALTVTGTTVANKVYDGLTTASLSGGSLVGIVGGDAVTLTQAGSFVDKSAGTAKAVTAADTLGGTDASNYSITQPTGLTADITPKALTVTGTIAANKVYDGVLLASLSGGSLVGIVGSDTVTLTQVGSFADKNVGTAKAVTAADTLGGTDAGNYSVTQPTGLSADITPKALTVTGSTVANKVYDGLTTASLTGGSLIGIVGSDTVTLTQVGSFV
ncbi:YDG domain-containing protein, partial [Roseateles cellulosilyticus]